MRRIKQFVTPSSLIYYVIKWTIVLLPVSIAIGSLVALFLKLLDMATTTRIAHSWLLFLLPLAGVGIHYLYQLSGKNAAAGNNLIIDEIHQPGGGVPFRMAPLVLLTTVVTHLFGGSAGREGTAVQMGGSIAQLFGRWFKLKPQDISIILMGGIAAGFGAVFGTPVTGAVFALEVLAIGRIRHQALLPCLMASVMADITCAAWGTHHTHYQVSYVSDHIDLATLTPSITLGIKVIVAGIAFGLAGRLFAVLTNSIKVYSNRYLVHKWMIPFIGGLIIIALTYVVGTRDYLGLGITSPDLGGVSITSSFQEGGAGYASWFWKLLFTAITIGMGFKGGEVTPLFFIGAALGNTIGVLTGAPIELMACIGFIAVFAGATNTPIACTIMGVELFGAENIIFYAIACFTAYYFSGYKGIYSSQLSHTKKFIP